MVKQRTQPLAPTSQLSTPDCHRIATSKINNPCSSILNRSQPGQFAKNVCRNKNIPPPTQKIFHPKSLTSPSPPPPPQPPQTIAPSSPPAFFLHFCVSLRPNLPPHPISVPHRPPPLQSQKSFTSHSGSDTPPQPSAVQHHLSTKRLPHCTPLRPSTFDLRPSSLFSHSSFPPSPPAHPSHPARISASLNPASSLNSPHEPRAPLLPAHRPLRPL